MKVLNVATFDILEATLKLLEQAFSHTNRFGILECLEYSFLYLSSGLTTVLTYFGLHFCGRIEVPKEPKVPLGDLDTTYNSLSF